jgi:hypothetical protein
MHKERPHYARVIGIKWVFRNKQYDQGKVVRNKAIQDAKGFSQVEGLNFRETFVPTATLKATCIFLAYASNGNMKPYQSNGYEKCINS